MTDGSITVVDTEVPENQTRIDEVEDENLNKISPPVSVSTAPTQSAQDKENELLRKQIEKMTKQAESMANLNDQYRERNAKLEELQKKKA